MTKERMVRIGFRFGGSNSTAECHGAAAAEFFSGTPSVDAYGLLCNAKLFCNRFIREPGSSLAANLQFFRSECFEFFNGMTTLSQPLGVLLMPGNELMRQGG